MLAGSSAASARIASVSRLRTIVAMLAQKCSQISGPGPEIDTTRGLDVKVRAMPRPAILCRAGSPCVGRERDTFKFQFLLSPDMVWREEGVK